MRGKPTRELYHRTRRLDREAAYDLARELKPDSVTEFVYRVCPVTTPPNALFDVLADAFSALHLYPPTGPAGGS